MWTVLQPFPILTVHYSSQVTLHYSSLYSYAVIINQKIEHCNEVQWRSNKFVKVNYNVINIYRQMGLKKTSGTIYHKLIVYNE